MCGERMEQNDWRSASEDLIDDFGITTLDAGHGRDWNTERGGGPRATKTESTTEETEECYDTFLVDFAGEGARATRATEW